MLQTSTGDIEANIWNTNRRMCIRWWQPCPKRMQMLSYMRATCLPGTYIPTNTNNCLMPWADVHTVRKTHISALYCATLNETMTDTGTSTARESRSRNILVPMRLRIWQPWLATNNLGAKQSHIFTLERTRRRTGSQMPACVRHKCPNLTIQDYASWIFFQPFIPFCVCSALWCLAPGLSTTFKQETTTKSIIPNHHDVMSDILLQVFASIC